VRVHEDPVTDSAMEHPTRSAPRTSTHSVEAGPGLPLDVVSAGDSTRVGCR
jgi:hypothetical protein